MKILACGYNGSEKFLRKRTEDGAVPSVCIDTPVPPYWGECYDTLRSADFADFQLTTTWQSVYLTNKGHLKYLGTNPPDMCKLRWSAILQVVAVGSSTVICLEECEELRRLHILTDDGSFASFGILPKMKHLAKISASLVDARKTPAVVYGFRKGSNLMKLSLEHVSAVNGEVQIAKEFDIDVNDLVAGREHYLLLTGSGQVFSWGLSSRGQLGQGCLDAEEEPQLIDAFEDMQITMVSAGGWSSMALNEHGLVFLWGWNSAGALGFPNRGVREQNKEEPESGSSDRADKQEVEVVADPRLLSLPEKVSWISCGERHAAAVSVTGRVYVWGLNQHGQLGLGDRRNRDRPVLMSTLNNVKVQRVICGEWTTVLLHDEPVDLPEKESNQ
ncbi:hypothetical protein RvY_05798 [Ramazzottius varieornatus]|uniref:RCC1 domain-containing protein 1 n=1 Tax=Ramazzottius varieornatus TaxID=947166 RepID=A0A1D1UWB5_RAMVA|nr:hypothetical protein RvY_05798 [Ramazzottius varieornatus]